MTTFRSAFKQLPGMTTLLLCLFMTLPLMTACGGDETGDSASSGGGVEGGDVELFTTAPESLKMLPSGNLSVTISGGKPPYTAMSSDNSVVSVAISGSSLDIRSWLEGNALVNIKGAIPGNRASSAPGLRIEQAGWMGWIDWTGQTGPARLRLAHRATGWVTRPLACAACSAVAGRKSWPLPLDAKPVAAPRWSCKPQPHWLRQATLC